LHTWKRWLRIKEKVKSGSESKDPPSPTEEEDVKGE
jgi:hypothetical protein